MSEITAEPGALSTEAAMERYQHCQTLLASAGRKPLYSDNCWSESEISQEDMERTKWEGNFTRMGYDDSGRGHIAHQGVFWQQYEDGGAVIKGAGAISGGYDFWFRACHENCFGCRVEREGQRTPDLRFSYVKLEFGLTGIKRSAFLGCDNLRVIEIPSTVRVIEDGAFAHPEWLTICAAPGSYAEQYAKSRGIPVLPVLQRGQETLAQEEKWYDCLTNPKKKGMPASLLFTAFVLVPLYIFRQAVYGAWSWRCLLVVPVWLTICAAAVKKILKWQEEYEKRHR